MARAVIQDDPLSSEVIPSYEKGYNSYAQSRTLIENTQVSAGANAALDGNGALGKRLGKTAVSPVLAVGYPVAALGLFRTTTQTVKLALAGSNVWSYTAGTKTALTGATYVPANPEDCRFVQAAGRMYVCAGTNALYYTADGATLTAQANAFPLKYGAFYNSRLYGVRPDYPDRIYYSNPINVDTTNTSYDKTDFGSFDTNLSATPNKKNSGFMVLQPESGLVITSLMVKGDSLLVTTLEDGYWEIAFSSISSTSGVVIHTISQKVRGGGVPASNSVAVTDNDIMAYGGDNLYYYATLALYAQPRTDPKSGLVQTDMQAVPAALRRSVVAIQFKQAEYVFYAAGSSFNDRCLKRDKILAAWCAPYTGWNVSCALKLTDSDGSLRLFAGSSDPADCRVFALEEGSDDAGSAIPYTFRDKALDGNARGQVKRFAYSTVYLSQVVGTITIQPYIDGVAQKAVTYTPANASGTLGGVGSKSVASFATADETGTATVPAAADVTVRVSHNYVAGDLIEFTYSNSTTGEQAKVLGRRTWYLPGDPQEILPRTKATVV